MTVRIETLSRVWALAIAKITGTRSKGHLWFWAVAWPLCTIVVTIIAAAETPVPVAAPLPVKLTAALGGMLVILPELSGCILLLWWFSVAVFSTIGPPHPTRRRAFCEAMLAFFALCIGIAFEFPTVLNLAYFAPAHSISYGSALAGLTSVTILLGALLGSRPGRVRGSLQGAVTVVLLMAFAFGLACMPMYRRSTHPDSRNVVLMGIDSVSQTDDLGLLKDFAQRQHGTFYTQAVTTGLITNAVWSSILMHRPVHETGVMLVFETPDWRRSGFNLVKSAHDAGYQTISFITDQSTTYVGSDGGFDEDHSSVRGWMRIASAEIKNGSILVPLLTSRLPKFPLARTRRNQPGTYCYDVRSQLHRILTAGSPGHPAFVAAHLEYLHQNIYPALKDLTPAERTLVLQAPVRSLQDWSYHWYSPEPDGEPLQIGKWKIRHLQQVLADEINRTGILQPQRQNRLVLFSDHGMRRGLLESSFGQARYYNVVLTTFGTPVLGKPNQPISLLDIPLLLGFADSTKPGRANPVVEYTNFSPEESETIADGATIKLDGRVILPEASTRGAKLRLRAFHVRSVDAGYLVGSYEAAVADSSVIALAP